MSIQANVNQALGAVGSGAFMALHLYQQTPAYKKMQALSDINTKQKQIMQENKAEETAYYDLKKKFAETGKELPQEVLDDFKDRLGKRFVEYEKLAAERYKADPTPHNYIKLKNQQKKSENTLKKLGIDRSSFDTELGDKANDRSLKEINSALRIKDTMNRMRGLYDE